MNQIEAVLVVLGTFFPLLWMAGVWLVAYRLPERRWAILLAMPVLGAAIAGLILEPVGRDGNMLAVLVYMLSALLLGVYYLGLGVYWLVSRFFASTP